MIILPPLVDTETTFREELTENTSNDGLCFRCTIERKSGCLAARRSATVADSGLWDLAAVGKYRRQVAAEPVKRLRHVTVEFKEQRGT
jgi:hypothetical protein